jgi:hypothetical protein
VREAHPVSETNEFERLVTFTVLEMKNKLSDLNNHLFAQLERLGDEDKKGDELLAEIERAKSVSMIAKSITDNARTIIDAATLQMEWQGKSIPMLEQL